MSPATGTAQRAVRAILPGDVDDVTLPSGGNIYDRRVCRGLAELGVPVDEVAIPGAWPRPDAVAVAVLRRSLTALPDGAVVLLDGLVACGVPEVVAGQGDRLRLAILVHLPLAEETGLAPDLAADLDTRERTTLRAAGAVVATSPWAARRLIDHHGLDADRVHVVTPGTDPTDLAPGTDGASRLVCVASVTPVKGHDVLVAALAAIADLPWRCACVGALGRDPAYVVRLRTLIDQHGLRGRVWLTGPRTGARLAATYAAADLVLLASRAETYGMAVTEALARGVPVVATAVGGVPETLGTAPDGDVPGLLVPADDATTLAAALRRWFTEEKLRRRLRTSARQRRRMLEARDWRTAARRMVGVLERLRGEPA